ncbi:hypothetical protein C8R43DRAFT_167244 [Mycena crocata]|nr:hypothetical protein C8R43DRAFT_167244 [Mycena crocata]
MHLLQVAARTSRTHARSPTSPPAPQTSSRNASAVCYYAAFRTRPIGASLDLCTCWFLLHLREYRRSSQISLRLPALDSEFPAPRPVSPHADWWQKHIRYVWDVIPPQPSKSAVLRSLAHLVMHPYTSTIHPLPKQVLHVFPAVRPSARWRIIGVGSARIGNAGIAKCTSVGRNISVLMETKSEGGASQSRNACISSACCFCGTLPFESASAVCLASLALGVVHLHRLLP